MEKDTILFFYSIEVLMMYWNCKHPTQFNLDKHEKDFQKESRRTKKSKPNIQRQAGKERQQVLAFRD